MERLNMTLDDDTSTKLKQHAAEVCRPRAAVAREILREGLERRERLRFRQALAAAYAADRPDVERLLRDLEAGQAELLDDEEA